MRTIFNTLIFFSVINVFNTLASDHTPEQTLRDYLNAKSELGNVFAQGTLDGANYRKLLRAAVSKDEASLRGIFEYTASGKLMGEGADDNCDILRHLLLLWGDASFARVLAMEPEKIRIAVIAAIDNSWPYPGWKPKDFPATYRLAKHVARDRQ